MASWGSANVGVAVARRGVRAVGARIAPDVLALALNRAALQDALRGGRAPQPGVTADALTFPTTVYEKCADRVGTLGVREADGVVRFYNFLNGFRVVAHLAVRTDVPLEGRIASLDFMLNQIETERQRTERLQTRLQAVADQGWIAAVFGLGATRAHIAGSAVTRRPIRRAD